MTATLDAATRARLLDAYRLEPSAEIEPIPGGLINRSYFVRSGEELVAVVQRLHPVFAPEVNLDLEAVTEHVAGCGLDTPRLIRTADDEAWATIDGHIWRAITYVDGHVRHRVEGQEVARAAGALVGRFHRCVDSLDHEYASARVGVHDTAAHLERLRAAAGAASAGPARDLAAEILAAAADLPPMPADLPHRHCHGDLKISNVLFARDAPPLARCLIDLDTLGPQTIAYELGDAMRSWCNPSGEDTDEPGFDLDLFGAAMRGYARGAGNLLEPRETRAIVSGTHTVCVELAARFCVDAFEDRYFAWDPARFASRREHNLVRARGQLGLARSVAARSERAEAIVTAELER